MPQRSEAVPKLLPAILKCLHIVAVHRSECPDPLPGPGQENTVLDLALRLAPLQHIVELDHIGIIGGEVMLEMLEEVIFMERADHAGAGLTVQPPLLQIVAVGVFPLPAHINKRKFVLEHPVLTGEGPIRFFLGESDVKLVGTNILLTQMLIGPVSQQLTAYKLLNQDDLVIARTSAALDLAGLSFCVQRPKGHGGNTAFAEVLHIVPIQVALKDIEWDTSILTGTFDEFDLVDHPDRLVPQVAVDDRIVARHLGETDRPPGLLTSDQCQCCALHTGPAR